MYELATEENIKEEFKEMNEKRFDYSTNTYRTWWGYRFGVYFENEGGLSNLSFLKRKIIIRYKNRTKEDSLHTFYHETGHGELFPIEFPFEVYAFGVIVPSMIPSTNNAFLDFVLKTAGMLGSLLAYIYTLHEIPAELYAMKRLGFKRWKNAWKEFLENPSKEL